MAWCYKTTTQPLASGANYNVTVSSQPAGQTCSVAHGTGTISNANVNNVSVMCSAITYTITASSAGNGSISPSGSVTVNSGGSQTFTATPNTGYGVNQWLLDGLAQTGGAATYSLSNITANHTLQVSFNTPTLTPSASLASPLALSVTGSARQITITNNGSVDATGVSVDYPDWPGGTPATSASDDCDSTLAAGDSCTITITPGSVASSDSSSNACTSGTEPVSGAITINADNAPQAQAGAVVLGYGCIYQGGFLFSVDDTTAATSSIGGKVVSLEDQAPRHDHGVIWSSNGTDGEAASIVHNSIWGIALGSTDSSPLPNETTPAAHPATFVGGQLNCNGRYDGACNINNILVYYSAPNTNPAITLSYYAAGRCKDYVGGGFSDWYLPAICEMGPASNGSGCAANTSSIVSNLPGLLSTSTTPDSGCAFGSNCLYGYYWSSTEYSNNPRVYAWFQYFDSGPSTQISIGKEGQGGVRCVRGF